MGLRRFGETRIGWRARKKSPVPGLAWRRAICGESERQSRLTRNPFAACQSSRTALKHFFEEVDTG